jgi:hypothetical protein
MGYTERGLMTQDDIETADRLSRRRARFLPVIALFFIAQQASYFAGVAAQDGTRTVDHVRVGAWLFLTAVILLLLTTGGFWFRRKSVRALMDDEVTRANRRDGMSTGFLAAMIGGICLYLLTYFDRLSGREAIHLLITLGIAGALLRFGYLERRAHRGG